MKTRIFWDAVGRGVPDVSNDRNAFVRDCSTLKMKAIWYFER
jgi:hypothetical protein